MNTKTEFLFQSNEILINLGKFHRSIGVPSDYFGVMGPLFLETIQPSLAKQDMWDEETQDAWLFLFGYMARVMRHGHMNTGQQ